MIRKSRAAIAALAICSILAPSSAHAEFVRFVQVVKNELVETRLHLSEIEAFAAGIVPDSLGGATFGGLSTSTNDIGNGALAAYGSGNLFPVVGTTNSIQHGAANQNPNNVLELGGNVWSTNTGLATETQYTLDLGVTVDVTTIRMWPRADTCCTERWRNLVVNLYADDGTGNPGTLVATSTDPRLLAPGGNIPLELTFASGSTAIEEITFTPAFTYPTASDPAILSSAAAGTLVGTVRALDEFGSQIPSATYSLVAGAGDTNNALYEIDGSNQLQVNGDLSGLDGVEHSVLVRGSTDEGDFDMAFTFTIILDSDSDGLIDSWELMFGTLADFMTGGDFDGDGDNDEDEFVQGTDPSVSHGALYLERFIVDDGGYVDERSGNTPIPSIYNAARGTWTMPGDGSGPAVNTLTSPPITVTTTGGIQVSFNHRYSIEPEWDGAVLQVSVDGGPFRTIPHAAFSQNGYTFFGLRGNHVINGGDGFNGDSTDYATGTFITSIADVGGVPAGGTITLRFLGAWDSNTIGAGNPNWEIDLVRADILPDQDGDGMPDSYETANSLDETMDDAGGDLDSDLVTNLNEYLNRTDPNDSDSDDDGLTDNVETNTGTFADANNTGTNPLVADTDGDGRSDGDEVTGAGSFTSDPNKVDTDGDGFNDSVEVSNGSNPNDPNSFPEIALLAYFNFDGNLVDQAGNSPDLVLGGPAALTTGGLGVSGSAGDESLDLMGVNDGSFAATPAGNHLDLASASNSMCVTFWQYNTQIASTSSFWLTAPAADGTQRGFHAHVPWSNGTVFFDQSGCCDPPERLTTVPTITLNAWQHFAFQRDAAGNREIWINGVLAASAGGADPLDPFDGVITIGAGFPSANSFSGRIDDFAIFSDVLTGEQIAELASGTPPIDLVSPPVPFEIIAVSYDAATGAANIEWNSRPNRSYAVDSSSDLIHWEELDDGISSEGEVTSFSDNLPVGTLIRQYRVREIP